ncbi:MAG: hypothetical protein F9B45_02110 [Phycisphaera sp. RhM]|nr:hypothetical protein [Phycisphaera sp. RhM]
MLLEGLSGDALIINNTIDHRFGNSVRIQGGSKDFDFRNNILQIDGAYAISFAADSQLDPRLDYNLYNVLGTAKLADWAGTEILDRSDWYYEFGFDEHGMAGSGVAFDPKFVDHDGADNLQGFQTTINGVAEIIDDGEAGFATFGTAWTSVADGSAHGGDYQISSAPGTGVNIARWTFTGLTPGFTYQVAATWKPRFDAGTVPYQIHDGASETDMPIGWKRVNQQTSPNDFTDAGSTWENIAIVSPSSDTVTIVLRDFVGGGVVVADAIHMVEIVGDRSIDDDFHLIGSSPAIDRGDPTGPYALEPSPNGSRINLGAYGNTDEAAISAAQIIQVIDPIGFQKFESGQTIDLRWNTSGVPSSDFIDLTIIDDLSGQQYPIACVVNSGEYSWTISGVPVDLEYRLKVGVSSGGLQSVSDAPFYIVNDGNVYYVGDSDLSDNEFTSSVGDNRKSGKSPDSPMASPRALIEAFDLDPNDVIYIDTGIYPVLQTINLTAEDSGVRIVGASQLDHHSVLDRGNQISGNNVIELVNGDDLTLEYLSITGGYYGVHAGTGSDSDNLQVLHSRIYQNAREELILGQTNDGATLSDSDIFDPSGGTVFESGVSINANGAVLTRNLIHGHYVGAKLIGLGMQAFDNEFYNNTGTGLDVNGAIGSASTVTDNRAYGNVTGMSATGEVVLRNNEADSNTTGIKVSGNVQLFKNVAYDNSGSGILLNDGAIADGNVAYGNLNGIEVQNSWNPIIRNNRVYNNSAAGIVADNQTHIEANTSFDNSVGILIHAYLGASVRSKAINNLIYGNTNQGIFFDNFSPKFQVVNNTIYQEVGDGIRITAGSPDVLLHNNIVAVEGGYALFFNAASQTGVDSDYNLVHLATGAAKTGSWAGVDATTLADWQNVSSQDAASLAANPNFVDFDGRDNIFGYDTIAGVDGSQDDNLILNAQSPAIDRAHSWSAPVSDRLGSSRLDDPSTINLGSPDYVAESLGNNQFPAVGSALNWTSDGTFPINLPFSFPFYGNSYSSVGVSTNGFIDLGNITWFREPTEANFKNQARIAPLWGAIDNWGPGDNVYLDTSIADQVTIRWDVSLSSDRTQEVQFSATLKKSGEIIFHYGDVPTGLSPIAGISSGSGQLFVYADSNRVADLNQFDSQRFVLRPGFADIGAYEFRGDSSDIDPPNVLSILPDQNDVLFDVPTIRVAFDEELNAVTATAATSYELRDSGDDAQFGNTDDVLYVLQPRYLLGNSFVQVDVLQTLPPGEYQLSLSDAIRDAAGNPLANPFTSFFTVLPGSSSAPGVSVIESNNETVVFEEGIMESTRDSFEVALNIAPTTDVTVTITSADENEAIPITTQLMFTTDNWFLPQTVEIVGVMDHESDGDQSIALSLAPTAVAGSNYDDVDSLPLSVTVKDLSHIAPTTNQAISEDSNPSTLQLNNLLSYNSLGRILEIDATSSDTNLLAAPTVTYLYPSDVASVVFSPIEHAFGQAVIEVQIVDPGADGDFGTVSDNGVVTRRATVTVEPVNDAPSVSLPDPPDYLAGEPPQRVFSAADLGVSDVDDANWTRATARIVNGYQSNADLLSIAAGLPASITAGSFDTTTGTITLTGNASLADYKIALSLLEYQNTSDQPTTDTRHIEVTVTDSNGTNAANGPLSGTANASFEIVFRPEVEDVVYDDGTAQRSSIRTIQVRFDSVVTLQSNAIEIEPVGGVAFAPAFTTSEVAGRTIATIQFDPQAFVGGSLADGNYRIRVKRDAVSGSNTSGLAVDFVDSFFRFFGDTDGDRDVDGQDYGRFGLSFLKQEGMQGFDADLDFDGDGDVDGQDYGHFGLHFLRSLPE